MSVSISRILIVILLGLCRRNPVSPLGSHFINIFLMILMIGFRKLYIISKSQAIACIKHFHTMSINKLFFPIKLLNAETFWGPINKNRKKLDWVWLAYIRNNGKAGLLLKSYFFLPFAILPNMTLPKYVSPK